MNTSKLKKFAQGTRRKLIGLISARLDHVLGADSAELRGMEKQVADTRQLVESLGREELIEKVAYTWFNRFMALRFMDVNDYHTFRVRVVSPVEGNSQPEILEQAKAGSVDDELKLDRGALDQEISAGEDNKALRRLIVAVCNRYFDVMPFMFEKVSDYTELLMPEDLLSESSVVAEVVEAMGAEDCQDVEVIGWLYQFYISEKKDEVFAALKKNVKITPQNIPAATQLFTPHWIVRYMVENSLGRLWLLNRPNSGLKEHMKYFVETEPEKEFLKVGSVEEIKLCDPACGSGHILVYAFDLLTKIYEEEGYDESDIPRLILEKNLFGIDIDDRAAALASFALVMKGRGYYRRFFRKSVLPSVISMQNVVFGEGEIDNYVKEVGDNLMTIGLRETLGQFEQAKNFGSLIKPEVVDVENVKVALAQKDFDGQMFSSAYETHGKVLKVLEMVVYLAPRYHCVVANPPYMGGKGMNSSMGEFVKENYKDTKGDLFACFMARCIDGALSKGYMSMINQHSWMFLSSFEEYRKSIIETKHISSMLHLGPRVFAELAGEVVQSTAFVIQNAESGSKGTYFRLVDERSGEEKKEKLESGAEGQVYRVNQKDFTKLPGAPIAYWTDGIIYKYIASQDSLGVSVESRKGMVTARNDVYVRHWSELSYGKIAFGCKTREEGKATKSKWFPYIKGGKFRKWYGNKCEVVNWENDGHLLQNNKHPKESRVWATNFNLEYIYQPNINWSDITSSYFSARISLGGELFDATGLSCFPTENNRIGLLAYLNSSLISHILDLINPTLHYQAGNIASLPSPTDEMLERCAPLAEKLVNIAKSDWDSQEISWDFFKDKVACSEKNRRIKIVINDLIKEDIIVSENSLQLQQEIDKIINDCVGVEVVAPHNQRIDLITLCNNPFQLEASPHPTDYPCSIFNKISNLLSYATGCMLGRYSLDKPGLILANQGETLQDYLSQIPNPTFLPDEDNIIPIVDGDYFEDDIVARFKEFLKVSFGSEHYQENLKFIEEAIGKDLRKYFLKDFYPDHIKRYKKRPIYWMFSSPKGSFNCLIYMHRYRPDTVSRIVSNYLQEYIHKLNGTIQTLESDLISADASASAKTKATKEVDRIKKVIKELNDYERDIMLPLAQQKIEIDLDDGVKQNYPKFGKALAKVTGLS